MSVKGHTEAEPPVKYEIARTHQGWWGFRIHGQHAWLGSDPAWDWTDAMDAADRHREREQAAQAKCRGDTNPPP